MSSDSRLRIVFMGTPTIAVPTLEALVAVGHEVVAAVTQPDRPAGRGRATVPPPVKEAALRLGLTVLQPATLRRPEVVAELRQLRPDAVVVAAFGQILRPAVLSLPPLGCLNMHPSLLPKLRGTSPISGAILEGLAETGVTVNLMDEGMDTGPILAQVREPVLPDDDAETLGRRLAEIGARLMARTLREWAAGLITPRPQDHSQATFTRLLRREDGLVDWQLPAAEIGRRARAYHPWPGAYTHWEGKLLKLLRVHPAPGYPTGTEPGRVLGLARVDLGVGERPEPDLLVATGAGALAVERLQLEGRRAVSASEFVRGYPAVLRARLGEHPAA